MDAERRKTIVHALNEAKRFIQTDGDHQKPEKVMWEIDNALKAIEGLKEKT